MEDELHIESNQIYLHPLQPYIHNKFPMAPYQLNDFFVRVEHLRLISIQRATKVPDQRAKVEVGGYVGFVQ